MSTLVFLFAVFCAARGAVSTLGEIVDLVLWVVREHRRPLDAEDGR